MTKIILGFVGLLGSGKGTAATMLKEKYGAEIHVFSNILKDILRRLGLPVSRENLQGLSTSLRTQFGQDLLAKAMAQEVGGAEADLIVIDGIRRIEDMSYLNGMPGFHLIHISAPEKIRYERVSKRAEKPGETGMSWEEFQVISKGEPELQIPSVAAKAEIEIDNSLDMEQLEKALADLLQKYGYES